MDGSNSPCPPALSYHSMSAYNEHIYLFGGCFAQCGRSNELWDYDITAQTWSCISSTAEDKLSPSGMHMPCSRGGPSMTAHNGVLYIGFGYDGKQELQDVWMWDISSKQWQELPCSTNMKPSNRSVTSLVVLPNIGNYHFHANLVLCLPILIYISIALQLYV